MAFALLGGGERRTAALAAHLAKTHEVTLFVRSPIAAGTIEAAFGIDLSSIRTVPLGEKDHYARIVQSAPELFINNMHGSTLVNPAPRGIYMCMFPERATIDLASYQIVTANSQFTADWIQKRWGYRAEVVYSACEDFGPPLPKENVILNVGRFFADKATTHHKRQDRLLGAFKELVDEGLHHWELRLVGHVGDGERDRAFLQTLREAAGNYPIKIMPDVEFAVLRDNYRKAAMYWHATGFETSEAEQPSKQEHFGMTIVEAMSAGAVPLVFNSGGPKETIAASVNGFLWNDVPELKRLTRRLAETPERLRGMADAAATISRQFNVHAFLERMDRLIARLT